MRASREFETKKFFQLCFITASVFLFGCVPAPAITQRSPQISGRVLNAATRKPVSGALVALHDAPRLRRATTDQSGHFLLKESWGFRLWMILGICGSDGEMLGTIDDLIDITHPAFHAERIYPHDHRSRSGELFRGHYFEEMKDIFLRPKRR